ncbi:MAG: SIMPL domain-containing protein [Planctomycetota bacterium]|jgi:uncharacterized protein YggE
MTRRAWSLVLPAAACLGLAAIAAADDDDREISTLTVRGEAELHKPADLLRLRVGVVTEDPAPTEALNRNSRQMQNVITALEKAGLDPKEYETGRFSVQPVYERRPRNAGADWRARIIGYEVTNSLAVKTKKLELAGKLIEAASDAGANSIDSIVFDLADPRTHRGEAIAAATTNARSDAGILARSAELKLARIISIALDEAGWRPPVATMRAGVAMAEARVAPPIAPGEVTVRASVTIVYEVEPAGK